MRLAVNIGAQLHLIKPYGFDFDDKKLRRAGLDYREKAVVREYESYDDFLNSIPAGITPKRIFCLTTKTDRPYTSVNFQRYDYLVFGPETRGLPLSLMAKHTKITIPMQSNSRSINLANAVAIASYEILRQHDFAFPHPQQENLEEN